MIIVEAVAAVYSVQYILFSSNNPPQLPCLKERKKILLTRNDNPIPLPSELHRLHPRPVSRPPPHRPSLLHIPQKHLPIPPDTREARIVRRDRDIQHRVPVGLILLDRGGGLNRGRRKRVARGRDGAGQVDGAVGGAGEEVRARVAGEGDGVYGACRSLYMLVSRSSRAVHDVCP